MQIKKAIETIASGILIVSCSGPAHAQTSTSPANAPAEMSQALVDTLLDVVKTRRAESLNGVTNFSGKSVALMIISNRVVIAAQNAMAAEQGARYTPAASLRRDVVLLRCGEASLGEIFNCLDVAVTTADGRTITPIDYSTGSRSANAVAGQSAKHVTAVFHARDLANGFMVMFRSDDGMHEFRVSASDADRDLFLRLEPGGVLPAAIPVRPNQLRVRVEWTGLFWRVTNLRSYVWQRCSADIGRSSTDIGSLPGDAAVTVTPAQFKPALDASDHKASDLRISCVEEDMTYVATHQGQ